MANSTKLISNMASRGIAKKRFQAIKSSHAKQVKGCVALPTLGRNQSMFDTHKYQDEMQSEPLGLSSGELSRASMISEQQEQEMSASTTITNSTSSTISEFFHARVNTFTKNRDTIASLVVGSAPLVTPEASPREVADKSIFAKNMDTLAVYFISAISSSSNDEYEPKEIYKINN